MDTLLNLPVVNWFDPLFFVYNLALLLTAVSIAPLITWVYVQTMKGEKIRRLRQDIPERIWENCKQEVCELIERSFRLRKYSGSLIILTIVIFLGVSVILLLKPLSLAPVPPEAGLDFSRGANILMLGPFIGDYGKPDGVFFQRLLISLTAFQFGFLGAYLYFISQLVRSYFTLDLTPHTFVDATVRIIMGSVVALVLSFVLATPSVSSAQDDYDTFLHFLPMLGFFLGFFPSRGLLLIEKLATEYIRISPRTTYKSKELSSLPGMSYAHELRLVREGFDNVENLSHGNAMDLAVRTGFSYCQLQQWIGQAWLCAHLGEHYDAFAESTGLAGRQDLQEFIKKWQQEGKSPEATFAYVANGNKELELKLNALYSLLA